MRPFLLWVLLVAVWQTQAQSPYTHRQSHVDVLGYHFQIDVNDRDDQIRGVADLRVRVIDPTVKMLSLDLVALDVSSKKGMTVEMVEQGRSLLGFKQQADMLLIDLPAGLEAGQEISLTVKYFGQPADGLVISQNRHGDRTFFGDNWPNRARHWLPTVDHPNDKASVRWTVRCPQHYRVVANGRLVDSDIVDKGYNTFEYHEPTPVPTKVMVVGIAPFVVQQVGQLRDVRVSSWAFGKDAARIFYDYAEALPIVEYFDSLIGPYSYAQLANVQSKTIFGGMENAGCIFYNETTMYGVPNDQMTSLVAHEIAHQWFGNSVSERDYSHIWVSEGFATYMAAHYLEHKLGVDKLRQTLMANRQKIIRFSQGQSSSVVDSTRTDLMELLNPNSYERGGWFLHMLRDKIGDRMFWQTLQVYYATYRNSNVTTDEFRQVAEQVSGQPLKAFFDQWLYKPGMPQFNIEWSVKGDNVSVCITQKKGNYYSFPLELTLSADTQSGVPGVVHHRIDVPAQRTFRYSFNQTGDKSRIWVDPRTVLLAQWTVKKK
jgi:aminopeptidase N